MKYISNNFFVEKVSSKKLAKKFDTPLYCYSYEKLKKKLPKSVAPAYDGMKLLIN